MHVDHTNHGSDLDLKAPNMSTLDHKRGITSPTNEKVKLTHAYNCSELQQRQHLLVAKRVKL